jgi:hypothetical protein
MKLMPLAMAAVLSVATASATAAAVQARAIEPIWPRGGIAERKLVGDGESVPENMFVEYANGKWIVWVLSSPVHGQTKALDFFSGTVENVTVKNPGGYADSFVDSRGATHKGTVSQAFYFKDPRPGGAIGSDVHVNVSSIDFGSGVPCEPELEVSERLSRDLKSVVWRKVILYPEPATSACPAGTWGSLIGTGMELRDGTMLIAAGNYVFRVGVDDLMPAGHAPHLHVVNESDVKRVIDLARGETVKDGSALLTERLRLSHTTASDYTEDR